MSQTTERKLVDRQPVFEPVAETVQRLIDNTNAKNGTPQYRTGLAAFDKTIFGLQRKHLCVIAARPGNGKTSLGCLLAKAMFDTGKKVAFISLEMSKEEIFGKLFCAQYKVDNQKLLTGTLSDEEKQKMMHFKKYVGEAPIRIIDDYCFTADELYTLVEHMGFKPEVLILDHIQQVRNPNERKNERENISDYCRYLKEIAMKHSIAVVCLCQINRQGQEEPSMAHLKNSGTIEEVCDECVLIHLNRSENFEEQQEITEGYMNVAKNRFGPTGRFNIQFTGRFGIFEDQKIWSGVNAKETYTSKTSS